MTEKTISYLDILRQRLSKENLDKLLAIDNPALHEFVARYVEHCNPDDVFVSTGSEEEQRFIREEAIRCGEERRLAIEGHTVHFDGYYDQARDRKNTRLLLPKGIDLGLSALAAGESLGQLERDAGLKEIHALLKDIMKGHRLYVLFFCLGPTNSDFSIPCLQLTDSPYVAHSENLLYRQGYSEFRRLGRKARFFKFVHSEGELVNGVSKNIDKRRIYVDLSDETVYSVNTQYGGNTIGLKKLAMRLAIKRASEEGWLTEHMFIMGVHGPGGRLTYFTGAFPSLCGKTSTSMMRGEKIVGDDIAYLKIKNGGVRAVNVEYGMFGIIQGVNSKDDPILWKALHSPGEIIFSNVLVLEDGSVYWIGHDGEVPKRGINHSGEWFPGKKDAEGNEIPPSHKNARLTLNMKLLENLDPRIDDPEGVEISGIIYGGRDSDTCVPVEEAFHWVHGIVTKGASLESEATAAVLGKEGTREFNPMANLDFLSIPLAKYIEINLNFGTRLQRPPKIFSVNYFLKEGGQYLTDKLYKAVWLKWMELRCHDEVKARKTPTGLIPLYEDLKGLFKQVLKIDYTREDYLKQFKLRIPEHLAKIDRILKIYSTKVPNTPKEVFVELENQRRRLLQTREKYGDYVSPENFEIVA